MRNLGGSVGIAAVTTLLARRSQFHQSVLAANITPFNLQVRTALQQLQQLLLSRGPEQSVVAPPSPIALLYGEMQRQAAMQAVIDDFWLMGMLMLVLITGLFFLRRPAHTGEPVVAH
jgi:DHA2 family multidrug resistance protein